MSSNVIRTLRFAGYAIALGFAGYILWVAVVGPAILLLLAPR